MSISSQFLKRRKYVNSRFSLEVAGKTNKEKSRILKRLWKEAKRRYK